MVLMIDKSDKETKFRNNLETNLETKKKQTIKPTLMELAKLH